MAGKSFFFQSPFHEIFAWKLLFFKIYIFRRRWFPVHHRDRLFFIYSFFYIFFSLYFTFITPSYYSFLILGRSRCRHSSLLFICGFSFLIVIASVIGLIVASSPNTFLILISYVMRIMKVFNHTHIAMTSLAFVIECICEGFLLSPLHNTR